MSNLFVLRTVQNKNKEEKALEQFAILGKRVVSLQHNEFPLFQTSHFQKTLTTKREASQFSSGMQQPTMAALLVLLTVFMVSLTEASTCLRDWDWVMAVTEEKVNKAISTVFQKCSILH